MDADRDIGELLDELGFLGATAHRAARAALEQAGLTNPRKRRISERKTERIRALLAKTFARTCGAPACDAGLSASRPGTALLAIAEPRGCERCGGSDNRKGLERFSDACRRHRVSRVVVVGGSPSVRAELSDMKPGFELRLVDGTERRTQDRSRADLAWAHLVLVWGSSELDHTVSNQYTEGPPGSRPKVVRVARRGIAALLNAGADHLDKLG